MNLDKLRQSVFGKSLGDRRPETDLEVTERVFSEYEMLRDFLELAEHNNIVDEVMRRSVRLKQLKDVDAAFSKFKMEHANGQT